VIKNFLNKYLILILFLFFTAYYIFFTYSTQVNVVWLSWFSHIPLVEKYFSHTLRLKDFITRYGEHGMLGYNFIFIFNLIFFKLNTLFDAYLNVFVVFLTAIIVYKNYKETINFNSSLLNKIFFIPLIFILFSVTQQSSGSMETQVRIGLLCFLFTCFLINNYLFKKKPNKLFEIIIFLIISINIFGTLYSLAWVMGIFLALLIKSYKDKKIDKNCVFIILSIIILFSLYLFEYNFFPESSIKNSPSILKCILLILTHPIDYSKWLFAYLGSSTLGRTLLEDRIIKYEFIFLLNGIFIFCLYIYTFCIFLISKMYKKTYLPIIMLCYTFFVGVLIMIGRQYAWDWGTNYWYAVHTKFGIAACIWILIFKIKSKISLTKKQKLKFFIVNNYPNLILIFIVTLSLIFSDLGDWRRAPYVKIWYKSKISYIYKPNPLLIDSNGLTPLYFPLKSTLEYIDILKKHHLNVFSTD
jgi:hypothetical protein